MKLLLKKPHSKYDTSINEVLQISTSISANLLCLCSFSCQVMLPTSFFLVFECKKKKKFTCMCLKKTKLKYWQVILCYISPLGIILSRKPGLSCFVSPPPLAAPLFPLLQLLLVLVQSVKYMRTNTSTITHTMDVKMITLQYCRRILRDDILILNLWTFFLFSFASDHKQHN